ncbi:cytochrome bd-type quinol oxidase subunit 2 [Paenibacillus shirakamiensis]|uniref:Cytochrome bd-type quinol oxidase subunit 2 n=1 Tax=Paenibacillus shirakamiensis TaxID=1265935 RepID=A0ABS4JL57_9BACL|nr:hypothetical protein [Paenibacillus shirakamiensis]MBP2002446.1 cytochrome bd-type quinol oxidase subunit 2 [Paenibacillus shirakamiensis]
MGWAFLLVMLHFASAWYGYGKSQLPYILYKYVNIYQNFTNEAMALAMITVFCACFIVLVLSLDSSCAYSCSMRSTFVEIHQRKDHKLMVEHFMMMIAPEIVIAGSVLFLFVYALKYREP